MDYYFKIVSSLKYDADMLQLDLRISAVTKDNKLLPIDCYLTEDSTSTDRHYYAYNDANDHAVSLTFHSKDELLKIDKLILNWNIYEEWKDRNALFDVAFKSFFEIYHLNFDISTGNTFTLCSTTLADAPFNDKKHPLQRYFFKKNLISCIPLYGASDMEWNQTADKIFYDTYLKAYDTVDTKELIHVFGDLPAEIQRIIFCQESTLKLQADE